MFEFEGARQKCPMAKDIGEGDAIAEAGIQAWTRRLALIGTMTRNNRQAHAVFLVNLARTTLMLRAWRPALQLLNQENVTEYLSERDPALSCPHRTGSPIPPLYKFEVYSLP